MTLKELRESRGISEEEIANCLCISRSTYERYEKDSDLLPVAQAMLLCRLLDCSVDDIYAAKVLST